ncbi:hypothetical protein C8J56DRAFT_955205 [Mycena floridula]|nr:hypothetical protein C8J56DRAFT_955205 [Mycena floridula]
MDNRAQTSLHSDLFSRGSTPPQVQPQYGLSSVNNASSSQLDSLFQNISSSEQQLQQNLSENIMFGNSTPTTPSMSIIDEPVPSPTTSTDRQNALLSLLHHRQAAQAAPQQVPTPPGSASQRSGASPTHNETQGKILLEQLMAGNQPRSNYSDSTRGSLPGANPSPPYGNSQQREGYMPHDPAIEVAQRSQPQQQQGGQTQQQPPSPRRSMFDFVSPFDALSNSGTVKKKPVPQQQASSSNEESSSWTAVSDPKRQSVDNLLEHLTRQVAPSIAPAPPSSGYESYMNTSDYSQTEQSRVPPPPIPPKPQGPPARTASPRASPPKTQAGRAPGRFVESPSSQPGNGRRDKESSPGPRGSLSRKGGQAKMYAAKNQSSPSPQAQSIVFDVSQPLGEIQAPRDSVKSTAIALVRQDSVFLPGTTIGATHWVAYAMTKGRVRVISRSSGDRTLLQLPPMFPAASSVSDMAVYGNRLAGVTSDGGFVVWELPDTITDDVPGQVLLCVPPSNDPDGLQAVKWHPKEPDTLAVASESQIYLIDLANTQPYHGQTLALSDLQHIGQLFTAPQPIVAFDFDVVHYALATIAVDSTLTIWNMHDKLPYTTHKIRGDDIPSSLTFVDGGIVVGRKNGTIFQLLSITNKSLLSTIKFVNGGQEDPDMFGHVNYDPKVQTLWVANSRRESMIAFRIILEPSVVGGEEAMRGYFDQVVEFVGPKPTIHFVILTADADPAGEEAYAACVAAKLPPGDLALVAFSVHSSGVDQILIRREWFDAALNSAVAKFPSYSLPPQISQAPAVVESKAGRSNAQQQSQVQSQPPRIRTPPSDDIEGDLKMEEGRSQEPKPGKGQKQKNVNFKDREDNGPKEKKSSDASVINESALGQALSREMKKTEESLATRLGRLISKEMDKQNSRMEEARINEQAEDFSRQEKILKLISTELTRNTTRVVEMAVKSEVQNSVLPALENITKAEVKAALSEQLGRVMTQVIGDALPVEMEKLLMRPDISPHLSRVLSASLSPTIERYVKDTFTKTLIQQSTALHQELLMELRNDIHKMKTELASWQGEALRAQESSIRELDRTVRALNDQVKFLSMNAAPPMHHLQQQPLQHQTSGGPGQQNVNTTMRQPNIQPSMQPNMNVQHQQSQPNYQSYQQPAQPLPQTWFSPIAAPQASHPATLPQAPPPQTEPSPTIKADQWDEIYLGVLHTQDATKLRELLSHTNPELIMPTNGTPLVSQAVILTLVHRLSALVGEVPPSDESFKTSLWWLQRSVAFLRPEDKLISDFIPRVVPNVQLSLNNTKQRLAILPGGPQTLETARTITDIQETLRRKVAS